MNDSTIRLSADTSALTDSLSKIAEEMTSWPKRTGKVVCSKPSTPDITR